MGLDIFPHYYVRTNSMDTYRVIFEHVLIFLYPGLAYYIADNNWQCSEICKASVQPRDRKQVTTFDVSYSTLQRLLFTVLGKAFSFKQNITGFCMQTASCMHMSPYCVMTCIGQMEMARNHTVLKHFVMVQVWSLNQYLFFLMSRAVKYGM